MILKSLISDTAAIDVACACDGCVIGVDDAAGDGCFLLLCSAMSANGCGDGVGVGEDPNKRWVPLVWTNEVYERIRF